MTVSIAPTYFTITDNHGTRSGAGWDFSDLYDQSDIYVSGDDEPPDMVLEVFDTEAQRENYVALASERLRAFGVPEEHLRDVAALVALAGIHYSHDQHYMTMDVLPDYGLTRAVLDSPAWDTFLLEEVQDIIYKQTRA